MNNPSLIKWLDEQGFSNKTICLITRSNQPYVTKVLQGKMRQNVSACGEMTEDEKDRYNLINTLITMPPIIDSTTQAIMHMHLLKKVGVTKKYIFMIYNHLSHRAFETLYGIEVDDHDFDSLRYLGLPNMAFFYWKIFEA